MASPRKPARTLPGSVPARRWQALKRKLPHPAHVLAYDGGFMEIMADKPSASLTACLSPLTTSSGKTQTQLGVNTHAGPDYFYVTYMCSGFEFGGAAAANFTPIPDGHAFTGVQNFCFVKKCSDGKPSASLTNLSGSIVTQTGVSTLEMTYECRAFCGSDIVCIEVGSFHGTMQSGDTDPLHAWYLGIYEWTLTCCPDVTWNQSLAPQ